MKMNEFWTYWGLCVDDLVYAHAPQTLCELDDVEKFFANVKQWCKNLGIEDDA